MLKVKMYEVKTQLSTLLERTLEVATVLIAIVDARS
jgi:hypothetical protein